ncbi:MAG: sulfatase-like hydrolase/transferase, partial [Thermoguttaceae bacterium]
QTYMVGKWHMELPGPTERGFDEFYGYTRGYAQDQWSPDRYQRLPAGREPELKYAPGKFYATDVFTDYALEFLKESRRKQAPWFLYLAHSSPHFPVQAPAASVERFVSTYRRGWDVLRQERFDRMRKVGLATDSWRFTERSLVPVDEDAIANGYGGRPNPAWDELPEDRREDLARRMAIFAAMVAHVDEGIGRIVSDLETNGELENTLILLTSDNGACYEWGPFGFDGESRTGLTRLHTGRDLETMGGPGTHHAYGSAWANLGNTPFRLYKHFTHEGGICSPMIAHWPAGLAPRNDWVDQPAHIMDMLPTICEAVGVKYPSEFRGRSILPAEGVSLLPALRGEPIPERPLAFEHQDARALRKGRWKVVWSKRMPHEIKWELYDIEQDRCETVDLAGQHPELTRALADEWMAWARRVKVYPFFTPETGAAAQQPQAPPIANRPLAVTCDVPVHKGDGVILAQGGNQHGYALHLREGRLVFSVRIGGKVTSIVADATPAGAFQVSARLLPDGRMVLAIDGRQVAEGSAGGLIPAEPQDGLSIGEDTHSAVGDYAAPNRLNGKVENVKVGP